jgi:nitrogenase molybdenum-iron protein alpha/beta subunit/predicted Fe-Mo cluster-binding NifX family protein
MNNLVSLNVNPCKMCMPMGAVSALCGIKSSMSILHGSQGCATYIRRHMATHYNEPIDIASSSLTEEGTVFGGEANLLKGLRNMIDLYAPEVIGVCTTCLAETIGEDVNAIVKKFYEQNHGLNVKIINIASPGYGGTQNEGWFAALRAILEQTEPDTRRNEKINIITPQISPADTRWLKSFLSEMGISFILLPDLSDNLDGATEKKYRRLKTSGTPLSDIAAMAGAKLTIEFSEFTDEKNSPAEYLKNAYGVPFVKLPLPAGIRGMEKLIDTLTDAGAVLSDEAKKERGRYLDAMVDSHKHCAEARAAVFGEPDFVAAMIRLCCENGILPVLAATGSVSATLRETLAREVAECANFHFDEETAIMDDSDFAAIEKVCIKKNANLLIGSSDGRRIARALNIPLIRCAFPLHDHVGGQRVRILGFEGSLNILDKAANAMIDKTETSFRAELYDQFYKMDRPRRFAVASTTGAIVDLHFGHADKFYIYESDETTTRFVETRSVSKYCDGSGCDKEDKWASVIRAVADCDAVLAMRIGPTPEKRLQENGIYVITTYERVETAVSLAAQEIKERWKTGT